MSSACGCEAPSPTSGAPEEHEGHRPWWRDAAILLPVLSGVAFLTETARRVRSAGFEVGNVAVQVIAGVAILLASINVFGGFLVTRRMLNMFQKG